MGALAHSSASTTDVEPGTSSSITVDVHNNGAVVDRYSFQALGPAAPWVSFSPDSLSLFPDTSETVAVTFSPPRQSTTPFGAITVGIRVASHEDPAGSVVEEIVVNVGAFSDIDAELVPSITSGRITGRARLAVDNRSNCVYRADLSGTDSKSALRFSFHPAAVDVPPGNALFAKVRIDPTRRFWRGPPRTHPLRVILRDRQGATTAPTAGPQSSVAPMSFGSPSSGGSAVALAQPRTSSPHKREVVVNGSMVQQPILPRWLLALIGILGLLVLLWFLLLKPQIRSVANDEVSNAFKAAGITTTTTPTPSSSTTTSTTAPNLASGPPAPELTSGPTVNGRLVATGNGTQSYKVPQGHTLAITDLLVENSSGDNGDLVLSRDTTPLMVFAMADFRDLDYHWITPTFFGPGTTLKMTVTGCAGSGPCNPAIYYAGYLSSAA